MPTPEGSRPEGEVRPEFKRGFTRRQKRWLKRAFEEVLGFSGCVFPVWNEEAGEYEYCRKGRTYIHHIKPRGWCMRVLAIDPNVPANGAPLCEEHHAGGQVERPPTEADQEVIHLDMAIAKRRKMAADSVVEQIAALRAELCGDGEVYWYDRWDSYLLELAEDVVGEYSRRFPEHAWPKRRVTQKRVDE